MPNKSNRAGFDISGITTEDDLIVWVDYNYQVSVQLRHVPREKLSAILKQASKTTWDKHHQPEQVVDNIRYGELLAEASIVDWTGIVNGTEPFPCTQENKRLLMRKWTNFAKFVSDISSDLDRMIEADKDAARKN